MIKENNNNNNNNNNKLLDSTTQLGYKTDSYTTIFITLFAIYYIGFFLYEGYSFSNIINIWNRLISMPKKQTSHSPVQTGTTWNIKHKK